MDGIKKEYVEHKVFQEIQALIDFYDSLSFSVMSWVSSGTTTLTNFDTYVFSSIQGTLESIQLILAKGRINDSYALLRKYYDSVIINSYALAYLEEHFNFENFIVEKINNWLQGKEKLPENKVMIPYLRQYPQLADINSLINGDKRYKHLRERCNNHMHYNLFYYMMINDNQIYDENRCKFLDQLWEDIRNVFILHFAYLFTLKPHYLSSSDYLDALEGGMTPEEGSQYWVAPFIQESFNKIIKAFRPDIAEVIKTTTGMKLE